MLRTGLGGLGVAAAVGLVLGGLAWASQSVDHAVGHPVTPPAASASNSHQGVEPPEAWTRHADIRPTPTPRATSRATTQPTTPAPASSPQPVQPAIPAGDSCPELGLFVNGQSPAGVTSLASQLGVSANVMTVYAWDNYTVFTPPTTSMRLLLAVGEVTPAEATTIGESLVASGHANTMIRIMWEMNGNWMQWGTQSLSAAQYISIYQAAEQAFAAVPGNQFQYIWNINAGTAEPGRTEFDTYPGDAYVSQVGIDFYDYNDDDTIPPILAFAAAHGKPVSFDEWGLNGTDNPGFIDYVASVVNNPANHVVLQAYFSFDGNINSLISDFPAAEAEYRKDFAGC